MLLNLPYLKTETVDYNNSLNFDINVKIIQAFMIYYRTDNHSW